MAKGRNRSLRGQNTSASKSTGNPKGKGSQPTAPVTWEDVAASANEAEFTAKKESLLQQLNDEIKVLEDLKVAAQEESGKAQAALERLKEEKEGLVKERDDWQSKRDAIQKDYDNAEKVVKAAEKKAESIKSRADAYALEKRQAADEECLQVQKEAADKARAAWQVQVDDLSKQIEALAARESALRKDQRELKQKREVMDDDREALDEEKKVLKKKKALYDKANPEKLNALKTELDNETSKYAILQKRHHDSQKRWNELQVWSDTIKAEIEDPQSGKRSASLQEIVSTLQELQDKCRRLESVCEQYPTYTEIRKLEETSRRAEELKAANETLTEERDAYREEVAAARNARRELEVVRQEVEATNALNEHLLQELESHKTALESRTGDTCPSLTKVDAETESEAFVADVAAREKRTGFKTLKDLVTHVKNYAGSRADNEKLFYKEDDIRAFLAGMAVSRLLILQGMSGTGKSSLPRIFSEAISGFHRLIPVESSWRDRNELLGYYNDFNKKFNAKSFTIELYRSGKERCRSIPTFIVLDEMNLARIEYYFSDFLAILQEPDPAKWLIELVSSDMRTLPMELPDGAKEKMKADAPTIYSIWEKVERGRQGDLRAETSDEDKGKLTAYLAKLGQLTGAKSLVDGRKVRVTSNIWFVGTANRDESTFEISDKVYDRAQVVSLNTKGKPEGTYTSAAAKYISAEKLIGLFESAISKNQYQGEVVKRLDELDKVLMEKFDLSFGNRIVTQTIQFVGVFTKAGGTLEKALDYQISTKILRKVITSDDGEALLALQEAVKDYPESTRLVEKRLKELE